MITDTTVVTVSFNAADALALMWESFKHHHPDFDGQWIVYDNGSTDGALEYAQKHANIVLHGSNNSLSHGDAISKACEYVTTPYLLHLDNDLEFHGPVLELLSKPFEYDWMTPAVYCSCLTRLYYPGCQTWKPPQEWESQYPYGTFDVYGKIWKGMWSPNIAVGLLKMEVVKRIHDLGISFGYYANDKKDEWYETGGMAYLFAKAMGYDCIELESLWKHVTHWGSLSTLWAGSSDPVIQERYAKVQRRLVEFRAEVSQ